jgi:hypothetical protein
MNGRGATNSSREGFSTNLETFIGSYHRSLVIGLSVAGLAAALILCWHFRRLKISDAINVVLLLLAGAILLRVLLFTYLDATWWIGGYERYLFPVAPIYSCFLIVLIYQSLIIYRRTGGKA